MTHAQWDLIKEQGCGVRKVHLDVAADAATLRTLIDYVAESLIIDVRQYITSQRLFPIVHEYPRDWWEAFKQRWFPLWACRRWPVRFARVTFAPRILYPRLAIPGEKSVFHVVKKTQWDTSEGECE